MEDEHRVESEKLCTVVNFWFDYLPIWDDGLCVD